MIKEIKQYKDICELATDTDISATIRGKAIQAYERASQFYDRHNKESENPFTFLEQYNEREKFAMAVAERRLLRYNGKVL